MTVFYLSKASLLQHIHRVRRLFYIVEQPISSKLFQTPEFEFLSRLLGMTCVTTWLGLYGHILMKGTKLLTNLPDHGKFLVMKAFCWLQL